MLPVEFVALDAFFPPELPLQPISWPSRRTDAKTEIVVFLNLVFII